MDAGEIGGPDYTRVIDQLSDDKLWLGMVATSGNMLPIRVPHGVQKKITRDCHPTTEHKQLGVQHGAQ